MRPMIEADFAISDSRKRVVIITFTFSLFLSAGLLFFIQPLYTKLILPNLGGSPAVWTTAMLFFQCMLLAGYAYAHFLSVLLPIRMQLVIHGMVMALGAIFLPIALPEISRLIPSDQVTLYTLAYFALGVGAPFFALSANAPLLQKWYAAAGAERAEDPYFLYAASNAGSFVALLAFPIAVEPLFGVRSVSIGWSVGYAVLCAGLLGCALCLRREQALPASEGARVSARTFVSWMALAAVPSAMMLSVTAAISTDIGSFPMIWVIPLAIYLASFTVAFSERICPPVSWIATALVPFLATTIALLALKMWAVLGWEAFAILIVTFALTALLFHRRLFNSRPPESRLTTFYFAMSMGGALGGIFNALLAPAIFNDVWEMPIIAVLAALGLHGRKAFVKDATLTVYVLIVALAAMAALSHFGVSHRFGGAAALLPISLALIFIGRRPAAFAVCAALVLLSHYYSLDRSVVERSRSFFGVYTVADSNDGIRILRHGTTAHGIQAIDPGPGRPDALSYYHPASPLGQVFEAARPDDRIAAIGLGIGTVACYRKPGQEWHFYEIDPEVDRIARDPELFVFMERCAKDLPTHLGDARVVLAAENDQRRFDLIFIDAFSSDSVPIHLLTREAMEIYSERLTDEGILLFHVSNRYFDLARVVGRVAPELGFTSLLRSHQSGELLGPGQYPATAVILGPPSARLAEFAADSRWRPLTPDGKAVWTDDFANLLGVLR